MKVAELSTKSKAERVCCDYAGRGCPHVDGPERRLKVAELAATSPRVGAHTLMGLVTMDLFGDELPEVFDGPLEVLDEGHHRDGPLAR